MLRHAELRLALTAALLIATCAASRAQSAAPPQGAATALIDRARREVQEGALAEDAAKVAAARALLQRAAARHPADALVLHYLGFALVREAELRWDADEAQVPPLLREAERVLLRSARLRPLAETFALLARIQGYMSAMYPRIAADLGARARGFRADAERLGADNPRVWLLRGQAALYTPEVHGGGLARAEEYLLRARELFRSDSPSALLPDWGRAETEAWLGEVYARSGRRELARAALAGALELAPGYKRAEAGLAALPRETPR
jgi:tetratricopeptide (TPR) repeat protein